MTQDPRQARLLKFLNDWRSRLLKDHASLSVLPSEQYGQVVALNTIIYYVEKEWQ